jgi:hypothetical protein
MKIFKFLKYVIDRRIKKFDTHLEIKKELKSKIIENNKNQFITYDEKLSKSILEGIIIKIIQDRSSDLTIGEIQSMIKQDDNLKIKLLGEKTYNFDNSKWVEIIKNGKLNENLRIKQDLMLSESHLVFIIREYFELLEIEMKDKRINSLILPLVIKFDLQNKNLAELRNILDDLFFDKSDKEVIENTEKNLM